MTMIQDEVKNTRLKIPVIYGLMLFMAKPIH